MILKIFKGLFLGFLLFVAASYGLYALESSNSKTLRMDDCNKAASLSLKALSGAVKDNWLHRKNYHVVAMTDRHCLFYTYYPTAGALYFGQQITSGHIIGVSMSAPQLHKLADTLSASTDFDTMLRYLSERAKTNPAPGHEF